jgi:hypothetical protein
MKLYTRTRSFAAKVTQRGAWLIVMLALVVVLALSACAGRGAAGGAPGSGNPGGTEQVGGGTTVAVGAIAQTDSDLDAIVAALDSANIDANIDESGKDTPVQP